MRNHCYSKMCKNDILVFIIIVCQLMMLAHSLDRSRVYMESSCGNTHSVTTSYQMDSSTGLTYLHQQDCTYTVTAPTGYFVVAIITRFELEGELTGACVDYLDAYDGTDKLGTKLNSDPICGWGSSIPGNLTSSGESMTLHFVTDNNGAYLGFTVNFVAATNAPCSTSQYLCNTSICIDSSLECDSYNQCGDSSDEDDCPDTSDSDGLNIVLIVFIVVIILGVIAVVVAYIVHRIRARNEWRKFLHSHIDDDDGIIEPEPSYPITHKYYNGIRGRPNFYTNDGMTAEGKDNVLNAEKKVVIENMAKKDVPSDSSVKS